MRLSQKSRSLHYGYTIPLYILRCGFQGCLRYSDVFISGSDDGYIRLWKVSNTEAQKTSKKIATVTEMVDNAIPVVGIHLILSEESLERERLAVWFFSGWCRESNCYFIKRSISICRNWKRTQARTVIKSIHGIFSCCFLLTTLVVVP